MDLDKLQAIILPGADGRRYRLGDLWASRPLILVFARHFG
jgi:hypothetical protein